eukprot:TRINITY_DN15958_c0_g1_i1.p1 TRINITY_DN15958_c0_g1~~TRINITY_DN15958_c0_g1_i1.p1  ORF type:complete len:363 (+),score=87.24 TRINITY_DN15958_c0_g1_i1:222-1310(+)
MAGVRGDRTLRVGSHTVPIDTAALSSRSSYFSSMFGRDFKEASTAADIVVEPPEEETFFHVLYYLMTGTMRDVTIGNFASIVANADFVQSEPLLEYLQQVALAYCRPLFRHPSFRPPRISVEFIKGFLREAKLASKLRSLSTAVHLLGPWLDADREHVRPVLDYARQLFPALPRTLEFKSSDGEPGKGQGKMSAAERRRQNENRQQEVRKQQDMRINHELVRVSSAFHFVQTMLKYPGLRKNMDVDETLCALDPLLQKSVSSLHELRYGMHAGEKRREKFEKIDKIKAEAEKLLSELTAKLHESSTTNEERGPSTALPRVAEFVDGEYLEAVLREQEAYNDDDYSDYSEYDHGYDYDSDRYS